MGNMSDIPTNEWTSPRVLRKVVSLVEITERVAATHQAGRLHLQITAEFHRAGNLHPTTDSSVRLTSAMLPPELCDTGLDRLASSLQDARNQLTQVRSYIDPRRVDVFQLGRLFCEVLAEADAEEYLRSPLVMSRVPKRLRPVIDGCLGLSPTDRYDSCEDVLAALKNTLRVGEDGHQGGSEPTDAPTAKHWQANQQTVVSSRPVKTELPFKKLGHYEVCLLYTSPSPRDS